MPILIHMWLVIIFLRCRREILHFEITESIKTGRILFKMVLPGGISHFRANLNSHGANADAAAPPRRRDLKKKNIFLSNRSNVHDDTPLLFTERYFTCSALPNSHEVFALMLLNCCAAGATFYALNSRNH